MMFSGLPDWRAWSEKIAFSRSTAAGSSCVDVERQRVGSGDVHRNLAREGAGLVRVARCLDRHQHAELAEIVGDRVVDIGRDGALRHR